MSAVRTCAACRGSAPRSELVRLARLDDGSVVVDGCCRLPGRGAWLHARADCIALVERKPEILSRAFRAPVLRPSLRGQFQAERERCSLAVRTAPASERLRVQLRRLRDLG